MVCVGIFILVYNIIRLLAFFLCLINSYVEILFKILL